MVYIVIAKYFGNNLKSMLLKKGVVAYGF